LQPVELRALQPDVEEHQMRPAVGDFRQRGIAVPRRAGRKSLVVENARHEIANIGFVIDNQNVTSHGLHLSCQLPVVAASIFDSLLVVSAGSLVSDSGSFISLPGSLAAALGACPD